MNIITRLTGSPVRQSARLSVVLPRTTVINIYPIYTKQSIDKISRNMCCYGEHAKQADSALLRKNSRTKLVFGRIPFFGPALPSSLTVYYFLHLANYDEAVPKISTINVNRRGRLRLMVCGESLEHMWWRAETASSGVSAWYPFDLSSCQSISLPLSLIMQIFQGPLIYQ